MNSRHIFAPLAAISLLILAVFAILQWLKIEHGNYLDWIIGVGACWWLVVVTVVPWNIYFQSRELLNALADSRKSGIAVKAEDEDYLQKNARLYITIAIFAHILTAAAFACISFFEISNLGYIGAVAALLLTFLRPILRLHQYVISKLRRIGQEIHYPREDIQYVRTQLVEQTHQLENLREDIRTLQNQLNTEENGSFSNQLEKRIKEIDRQLGELTVQLKNADTQNKTDHEQLKKHAENAIAQLSEDAKFLSQAREIIRFIKSA